MQGIDIRPLKQRMRTEIKEWRRSISAETKAAYDDKILGRLLSTREYQACETVLTYVSLPIEVDTFNLMKRALADGKRVAVPRCVDGSRLMEFYYIESLDQLVPRTFGVLEPLKEQCELVRDFQDSICIVPALAYDRAGYRLGYGAGYYDRFLSNYPGTKIGIIYAQNLRKRLWSGRYDIPVDLILTERRLYCPASAQKRK